MLKVCGLSLYGAAAASTRYRLEQYRPRLSAEGIELELLPLLPDTYIKRTFAGQKYGVGELLGDYLRRLGQLLGQRKYDLAIVQAELFPFMPGGVEATLLQIPYIYDFDDAFFLKYRQRRFEAVSFLLQDKFDPVVRRAAAVTAGSNHLAAFAEALNSKTTLLPTVVDTQRYLPSQRHTSDVFTVGWIGSPSTSVYLHELHAPLAQLGREGKVRFVVVGGRCGEIENVEVLNLPWSHDTEVELINSFHIGVMPLSDDPWSRGKCAFKLIQYMACAIPVVASPVGANVDVATPDCGYLAADAEAWLAALRRLRDDEALRRSMGAAGRRRIEAQYSLDFAAPVLTRVIRDVAETRRG